MKVTSSGRTAEYRTIWLEGNVVKMIDQPKLPHFFRIAAAGNHKETADAIRTMVVRGAPAIGAAGAFGIAQAALEFRGTDMRKFSEHMKAAEKLLSSTRPTAYDLFHAIGAVMDSMKGAGNVASAREEAVAAAKAYADGSAEKCRMIGVHGEKLIKSGYGVLTHCNAGALACVDYGTALAPMRAAHAKKKMMHVFVDETRPRLQGANLTAWEMAMEGIPHSLIADNAAGHFMQRGEVDIVIVGADRIAANGDVANKIGTYEKAVLAKENGIPFYVAAPSSTIDLACRSGKDIPIEERPEDEVLYVWGRPDNPFYLSTERVRIAPRETHARNPSFDVTPARYVTGIITEKGVVKPSHIHSFMKSRKDGRKG
ncbi:MAG: S-methyl-5-thioribose-1-phosphate isomerase [Candidatus Aenigmatarchaeota archaeon]